MPNVLAGELRGEYYVICLMNKVNESRELWHPHTAAERETVLRELEQIIASSHFCNSKRYPALLKFIVENTLDGKGDDLKERTIGILVFDRPPTYDTNSDTVVRYTAGEVRKRLLLYYSEQDDRSGIRISLPAGTYVPQFLREEDHEPSDNGGHTPAKIGASAELPLNLEAAGPDPAKTQSVSSTDPTHSPHFAAHAVAHFFRNRITLIALAVLLVGGISSAILFRSRTLIPYSAVDDFWDPVLHDQHSVIICTGGSVFQQNNFSGVLTAGKDIEYPFVSMQIASAITQVSALVERAGKSAQLLPAPSTPLSDLREHPVVLLGGYNNQWAMRLLEPQRFHFTYEPVESIVDRNQPQVHWSRDRSLPYSSAEDYAIVARFRDETTGNWVVALAGLGRNGSEAAAQFASSQYYMQMLEKQLGGHFSTHNVEAVLKLRVIDGKTGAPSIVATHVW